MCGRYNFSAEEAEEIKEIIREINDRLYGEPIKTGEIYPTNRVPVLVEEQGIAVAQAMTWGFPHWQKSGVIINARSETVTERKMFRDSVLARRCVVPSTGFYEWSRSGGEKTKHLFREPGRAALYMAGFWNTYKEQDGTQRQRFVILTTAANDSMKEDTGELSLFPTDLADAKWIHDRMPVILGPEERCEWLSSDVDFEKLFRREHISLEQFVA